MSAFGAQITGTTVDELYGELLGQLVDYGESAAPRGRRTKELIGLQLVLEQPQFNIVCNPVRNLNYAFSVAEWVWIMLGSNDAKLIVPYNKNIAAYSNDATYTFDGAYGPRYIQQLGYVLETLQNDPDSRQAVIDIWLGPPRPTKDVPCTLSMQFIVRDNDQHDGRDLHMITTMRSNDAWLGFPYDVFNFTQIQRYIAMLLGVGVGTYVHNVGSMHLYEEQWDIAPTVIRHSMTHGMERESPPLTRIPKAFQSVAVGLPLMATDGYDPNPGEILSWVDLFHLDEPWQMYLQVMAYRFHKNLSAVPEPYQELIRGQETWKTSGMSG